MKTWNKKIYVKLSQLGSLLLVTLFLSISVIQVLHSHKFNVQSEQSSNSSDETVSEASPCPLCDYLTHNHSKELFIAYAAALVLPVSDPITFQPHSFVGNYKFTLQGFTNKGPPAFSCK
ncbi:MAG: hypothetical protein WKF66_16990 [Pedobacter sp.]